MWPPTPYRMLFFKLFFFSNICPQFGLWQRLKNITAKKSMLLYWVFCWHLFFHYSCDMMILHMLVNVFWSMWELRSSGSIHPTIKCKQVHFTPRARNYHCPVSFFDVENFRFTFENMHVSVCAELAFFI